MVRIISLPPITFSGLVYEKFNYIILEFLFIMRESEAESEAESERERERETQVGLDPDGYLDPSCTDAEGASVLFLSSRRLDRPLPWRRCRPKGHNALHQCIIWQFSKTNVQHDIWPSYARLRHGLDPCQILLRGQGAL